MYPTDRGDLDELIVYENYQLLFLEKQLEI